MAKEQLTALLRRAEPFFKRYHTLLLILFAGILVMVLAAAPAKKTDTSAAAQKTTSTSAGTSFDLTQFENKLAQQLGKIQGAGRVSVTLTLDTTQEEVYATDVKRSQQGQNTSSYESTLATMTSGNYGQQPVQVKQLYPTFRGALVLCDGAADPTVQLAVTQAVGTVCGISTDKITVLKMQS